ncbi:MAG: hypothetical protein HBSAPP03_24890 [Phycisphaerae bacterium]|nr:MAG: hypothetical protein HBSAPP03_24890 [Phycisphaerae bacterium]
MGSGTWYTVQLGDCLSLIGEQYGVPWMKIWKHAENESLRAKRGNPNILHPGDKVFIPTLEERKESCATEQKHSFRRPGKTTLRIAILGLDHAPMKGVKYRFILNREEQPEAETDGDGIAQIDLPRGGSRSVRLRLPWGEFPVEVGELAPAHTVRGIQQRLRNLGIDPGPIDGIWGPLTARGISEFQTVEGLDVTGKPGPELIRRLRKVHEQESHSGACEQLEEHAPERNSVTPSRAADVTLADPDLVVPNPPHIPQDVDLDEDEDERYFD